MPRIPYTPVDFNPALGPAFTASNVLMCTWADLFWAAITVGRASWDKVIDHGRYSAYEIIYRGAMLYANLAEENSGDFLHSSAFDSLDPSEKGAVSYFLGLACSKLFAEKKLGVPWLMHLDVYKDELKPSIIRGERPDLVGFDQSLRWIVIEAKGRTGAINDKVKQKANKQAKRIVNIDGVVPCLQIGVIAHFPKKKLELFVKDPPTPRDGHSLTIASNRYFSDYYRLFIDLIDSDYGIRSTEAVDNSRYYVKYIQEIDAFVGLNSAIYELFSEPTERSTITLSVLADILPIWPEPLAILDGRRVDHSSESQSTPLGSSTTVGRDGIYVRLGDRWGVARGSGLPVVPGGRGSSPASPTRSSLQYEQVGSYIRNRIDSLHSQDNGLEFISELLDIAVYVARIEQQVRPWTKLSCQTPVLTAIFDQVSSNNTSPLTRNMVNGIDGFVQKARSLGQTHETMSESLIKGHTKEVLKRSGLGQHPTIVGLVHKYLVYSL